MSVTLYQFALLWILFFFSSFPSLNLVHLYALWCVGIDLAEGEEEELR